MTALCRAGWKGPLRWLIRCIAMILSGGVAASAQQPDQVEQQLQQLKQQYVETTRNLEQRIRTLEQQIEKQKEDNAKTKQGTVSAVELGAKEAVQKLFSDSQIRSGRSSKANYLRNRRMTSSRRLM
jgi:Skp family chaperone for outer membrane proteins